MTLDKPELDEALSQMGDKFAQQVRLDQRGEGQSQVEQLVSDLRLNKIDFSDERVADVLEGIGEATGLDRPQVTEVMRHLADNAPLYLDQRRSEDENMPEWLKDLPLKSVELYFGLMEGIIKFLIEEEKRR